ncbi:MAG TPA: hypothetical protein VGE63_00295 [Candidatus Paceibacterota bacterium]
MNFESSFKPKEEAITPEIEQGIQITPENQVLSSEFKVDQQEVVSLPKILKLLRTSRLGIDSKRFIDILNKQFFRNGFLYDQEKNEALRINGDLLNDFDYQGVTLNQENDKELVDIYNQISIEIDKNYTNDLKNLEGISKFTKTCLLNNRVVDSLPAKFFNILNKQFFRNGFLYDQEKNEALRINGDLLNDFDYQGMIVSPQQEGEITPLIDNQKKINAEREDGKLNYQSLRKFKQIYISKLLKQETSNLKFFNILNKQFFRNGFLYDQEKNEALRINGDLLNDFDYQGAFVKDQQLRTLYEKFLNLYQESLPEGMREAMLAYINTPEDLFMGRMEQLMDEENSMDKFQEIQDTLVEIQNVERRINFKKEFFDVFISDPESAAVDELLTTFEQKDNEDIEFIRDLAQLVEKKRYLEKLKRALDTAKSQFAGLRAPYVRDNFDKTYTSFDGLISGNSREIQIAIPFLETIAEFEVASFEKTLWDLIKQQDIFSEFEDEIRQQLALYPDRQSIGSVSFIDSFEKFKEEIEEYLLYVKYIKRIKKAVDIRQLFTINSAEEVLKSIEELPRESEEDLIVAKQLIEFYKNYAAKNSVEDFDKYFGADIELRLDKKFESKFINPERGRNRDAMQYLRENLKATLFPLIEFYKQENDPEIQKVVESVLGDTTEKRRYEQRLIHIASQRQLSDRELSYLQSVELLSLFNPFVVTTLLADFGVTQEFLKHHFTQQSEKTLQELDENPYVPMVVIGTGPSGVTAMGEITRNNPLLAQQTLVVDDGLVPGGPFAIPEGPAWELNSANRRGLGGYILPDSVPVKKEKASVRGYGSPFRYYPGERNEGETVRAGSINTAVDYLPVPDDLSNARYPTNEELQAVLATQTALLTKKLALSTKVLRVEPNEDHSQQGTKKVTLEIRNGDQSYTKTIFTDAMIVSTGLGEANLGINLPGSKLEKVLEIQKGVEGFPRVTTTLEAFNKLASRTQEPLSPGETIVIYGDGNSADTMIEFIGNIFNSTNPRVRETTKIYVISKGQFSTRPRYSLIGDIKARNGRGNLVEIIQGRVGDVGFSDQNDPESPLALYDAQGNEITDNNGKVIRANSVIAATGFKPELTQVFEELIDDGDNLNAKNKTGTTPLVLPTNNDVAVAETLTNDPTILFVGTASNPAFNLEKYAQLPQEAREALLRNGAENAVAIGFRAPDTQAALNIWLNKQEITLNPVEPEVKKKIVLSEDDLVNGPHKLGIIQEEVSIPNNVRRFELIIAPVIAYNLGNAIEIFDTEGKGITQDFEFTIVQGEDGMLSLEYPEGQKPINQELYRSVIDAVSDDTVLTYVGMVLKRKRVRSGRLKNLMFNISFKNGKCNPGGFFVE